MDKYRTENQINGRCNQNQEVNNDRVNVGDSQLKSRSTG